jgi:hypothetical protein
MDINSAFLFHGELNSAGLCQCDYCYFTRVEMNRIEYGLETSWETGRDYTRFVWTHDRETI